MSVDTDEMRRLADHFDVQQPVIPGTVSIPMHQMADEIDHLRAENARYLHLLTHPSTVDSVLSVLVDSIPEADCPGCEDRPSPHSAHRAPDVDLDVYCETCERVIGFCLCDA